MIKVGIIGATGYVGQQLVALIHHHKECDIEFLSSNSYADIPYSQIYGHHRCLDKKCIKTQDVEKHLSKVDLVFIALPHGMAFNFVKKSLYNNVKVIDIGADFRLKDVNAYESWYKVPHEATDLISEAVYGLPEIYKDQIEKSSLIANPGCYPTAGILGLMPLLKHKLIDPFSIIIDAKSGVTGAGRSAKVDNLFSEVNESLKAYSVASHRHTPEIEQELSKLYNGEVKLTFTPHLIPMNRGILNTCYGTLAKKISKEELYELYKKEYEEDYFIRVTDDIPETKWVKGTNFCDIGLRVDERTNRVIVVSAIDNMMKGAAGQGVQNMNIMFGLEETRGLQIAPMIP